LNDHLTLTAEIFTLTSHEQMTYKFVQI